MRDVIIGLPVILAASCATATDLPLASGTVRDERTAIQIGQEACLGSPSLERARTETNWHAEFHHGVWHVWQQFEGCSSFETTVIASTGKSDGSCSICVT